MAHADMVRSIAETWKTVANTLSQTEERDYGSPALAEAIKSNVPHAGRHLRFYKGLGLLTYRSDYGVGKNGGQKVMTKLLVSLDDGLTAIYKHFDAGRSFSWFEAGNPGGTEKQVGVGKGHHYVKAEAVVVADERSTEEVRAIAGPEPERAMQTLRAIRMNEPEALIEAARQYANRTSEVTAHIEALKGLGVEVDMDRVMSGISLTADPILETVATLLPYIDRLQRKVDDGLSFRNDLTEARREVGVITKERNDLKAANQRLSERNIRLAAEASGKSVQAQA